MQEWWAALGNRPPPGSGIMSAEAGGEDTATLDSENRHCTLLEVGAFVLFGALFSCTHAITFALFDSSILQYQLQLLICTDVGHEPFNHLLCS